MGEILRKKRKLGKRGFTLIELIVVIAIVAILAVVGIPAIAGLVHKAQQALCDDTMALLQRTGGEIITGMEADGKSADEIYNTLSAGGKYTELFKRAGINPKKFDKILVGIEKDTVAGVGFVRIKGIFVGIGDIYASNAWDGAP